MEEASVDDNKVDEPEQSLDKSELILDVSASRKSLFATVPAVNFG